MSQPPSAQKVATTSSVRPSSSAWVYDAMVARIPSTTSAYVIASATEIHRERHRHGSTVYQPVGTIRRLMPASEPDVDVLVVGAGITGLYQLYRAREAGFSVRLLEAGDGVGGTWYWNRYPGARFDSESYTYGYLFSQELWDEWQWQEHFAGQPEIERYLNHVVDRFDLRRDMRFGATVTSAVWDDATATWHVSAADG